MPVLPHNASAAERERLAYILGLPEHPIAELWLEAEQQVEACEGELETAIEQAYQRGLAEGRGPDTQAELTALRRETERLRAQVEQLRRDLREAADWLTSEPARLVAQRRSAAAALRVRAACTVATH